MIQKYDYLVIPNLFPFYLQLENHTDQIELYAKSIYSFLRL